MPTPRSRAAARRLVIGVIADTHGLLRPEALTALEGSDLVLHAGDVGTPEVLATLGRLAPVHAVRGNNDRGSWARELPATQLVEVGGATLYMLHDVNELDVDPAVAGLGAVIAGHSHKPRQELLDGVLYFNPGSAGPRRFKLPIAVGRIIVDAGHVSAELLCLDVH